MLVRMSVSTNEVPQEVQLSPTNRPTLVHTDVMVSRAALPGFIFVTGKLEWLGYNLVKVAR